MPKLSELSYQLPDQLARFAGPDVKREVKVMAARGMLPLPPRDLAVVLFSLTRDPDPELSGPAEKSLLHMPEGILKSLTDDIKTHPLLLDFLARKLPIDSPLQESITLNKSTHDETICFHAGLPNKRLVDIVSENQIRILRNPGIVDALAENLLTGQAQLDRILKFVELETRRSRKPETMTVEIEEVREKPEEAGKIQTGPVEDTTPEGEEEDEEVGAVTTPDEEEIAAVTLDEESPWAKMTFDADLLRDHEAKTEEEVEEIESNLYKKIMDMKVSEKIKLAIMGGANARGMLIKDSNKMVSCSVLKSPRITESEIETFSKSRGVAEDVIRIIANSREWTKNYQIKLNLALNPKTPQGDAMRFLNYLRDKDLKDISRSKNVPANIAGQAKRIIARKEEKSKPTAKKH